MGRAEALQGRNIDRQNPTPPYYQLYSEFRRQVESGELQPGERLPTISQIALQHHLSRSTVARALTDLNRDGLIVSRWGSGSYVAERSAPTTELLMLHSRPRAGGRVELFYHHLMDGLRAGFPDENRRISLSYLDGHAPSATELLAVASARRADSLVVYRPPASAKSVLTTVAQQLPTVTLFDALPDVPADAVIVDVAGCLLRMLRERIARGQRSLLLAAIDSQMKPVEYSAYYEMVQAYRQAMDEAGIERKEWTISAGDREAYISKVQNDLPRLLDTLPPATTVVTHMAVDALLGRPLDAIFYTEAPETMAANRAKGTTLYADLARIGRAAAELVLDRQADRQRPPRIVTLQPDVLEKKGG